MSTSTPDLLEKLRDTPHEDLVSVMLEVRAEMLFAGEPAVGIMEVLNRMCTLLHVDPAALRQAMH